MCMHLPVPLVSVSTAIQDILFREFGRLSLIVPNGIDCEKFYPAEGPSNHSTSNGSQVRLSYQNTIVLILTSGFRCLLKALNQFFLLEIQFCL